MVVQNGVKETRHAGLTVNIPEYRAPKVGPQRASPSVVASPMFGARENFRHSPSPERKTSAVNFNRENLLNEPGDAGRAPMLGPQHASPSAVASPMFGARENLRHSPSPERKTSAVNFNRENLLNEPGDAEQESPLFSLGIARARYSSHGGTVNTMGSRPSSDSSGTHTEGGSDMYRTVSRASSGANSTVSFLHRCASHNVAHAMHMLASGRHGSSSGSINSIDTATRSESAASDVSG
jgi:hypothetical protein